MEDIINVYEELEKILDIHGKDEKRFQHFDKKSVEVVRVSDDGQVATVERAKAIVRIRDNVDVSDEDLAIYKSQCEKLGGYFDEKEKAFVFDKDFNGYYQETLAKLFAGTPIEEMMQGKWNMHGGYKSPADKNRTNELQEGFMRNKLRELEDYEYLFDPRIDEMVAKYYGNGTILTEGRLFIELDKEATARIQSVPGYEGYKQFELTFTEEGLNSLNKVKLGYVVSYPDGRYEIKTEPQPTEEKDMLLALVNGDNSNGIKTRNVDGEEMVSLKYRDINKFCEDIEKIVDYQKNLDNQREEQKESNIKNALDEIMKRLNTFDQYTRKEDFKKAYDNFMQIDVKETPLLYQEEGPGSRVVFHMTTSSKEKWQKYVEIAKTVGGHYEKGVGFVFDKPFLGYDHRTIARLFVGEDVNSVMMGNLNYDGEGSYDTHYRQNPELNEGFMRKKLRMQVQIPRPDMAALAGRFEFIYNREETTRLPQTEEEASFANNRNLYFDLYVEGGRVGHVISRTDGSYQIKTEPKDAEFAGDLKTLRSEYCDVLKVGDKVSLVYKDVNRFKKDFKKIEEVYQEIAAKNSEGESVGEGYGQVKEKDGEAQTAGVSETSKTSEDAEKGNGLVKGKESVRETVDSVEEQGQEDGQAQASPTTGNAEPDQKSEADLDAEIQRVRDEMEQQHNAAGNGYSPFGGELSEDERADLGVQQYEIAEMMDRVKHRENGALLFFDDGKNVNVYQNDALVVSDYTKKPWKVMFPSFDDEIARVQFPREELNAVRQTLETARYTVAVVDETAELIGMSRSARKAVTESLDTSEDEGPVKEKDGEAKTASVSDTGKTTKVDDKGNSSEKEAGHDVGGGEETSAEWTSISAVLDILEESRLKHPDALFVVADKNHCNLYGTDAITFSTIISKIPLTKIKKPTGGHLAMVSFPKSDLDIYLPKLVRAGQRVAILDDIASTKQAEKHKKSHVKVKETGLVKEKDGEAQTAGVSETGKTIEADDKENGLVKEKDSVREAVESDEEEGLVKEKEASETSNVNEHDDDTVQEDVSVPNDGQIHFPDEEPAAGTEKPAGENVGLVKEKDGADEEAVGEDKTAGMSEEESPLSDKDQGEEVDAREENGLVSDKEAGEGISAEDTKAGKVFGTSKAAGTTKTTSAAEANAEGGANETKEQTNKQTNKNRHGKDDNNPGGSAHEASDRDDNRKGGEGVSNGQGGIRQEHEADDPLSDSVVGTPQPSVDGDRGTLGGLPEPDKEGAVVRRDGGRQTGDGGMGDSEGHGSTREGIDGGIPSGGGPQGGPSGILPGAADKLRQDKGDDDGKRGTGVDGGHADTGDDYLSLYTNRTDGGRLTGQNANAYLQKTSPEKSGSKENIAIMELLADILEANRSATPEERAELARYSGWGGKNDFYDYQTTDRIREVCKRLEPYTKTINAAYTANRLYNEIYSSTLNAYYTPNEIVDAIQHFVKKAGFEASLDIAFSAVGFIGPFGAGISAGYFLVKTGYTIYKSNKE